VNSITRGARLSELTFDAPTSLFHSLANALLTHAFSRRNVERSINERSPALHDAKKKLF
jgi:hypothetical protein